MYLENIMWAAVFGALGAMVGLMLGQYIGRKLTGRTRENHARIGALLGIAVAVVLVYVY